MDVVVKVGGTQLVVRPAGLTIVGSDPFPQGCEAFINDGQSSQHTSILARKVIGTTRRSLDRVHYIALQFIKPITSLIAMRGGKSRERLSKSFVEASDDQA